MYSSSCVGLLDKTKISKQWPDGRASVRLVPVALFCIGISSIGSVFSPPKKRFLYPKYKLGQLSPTDEARDIRYFAF